MIGGNGVESLKDIFKLENLNLKNRAGYTY